MQRFIKSLTGSSGSPSKASVQNSLVQARNALEKSKIELSTVQQMPQFPQFPQFDKAARLARKAAEETQKSAELALYFTEQEKQHLQIVVSEETFAQLRNIMTSAQVSSTRIEEGMQAATAHAYAEGLKFYADQILTTLHFLESMQNDLTSCIGEVLTLVEKVEAEQLAIQQANQAKQEYLAQFGGIDPEEIIAQIQSGTYLPSPAGIILQKAEIALFTTSASLAEDRTTTQYIGSSVGYSFPVGHAFRFRVGSYRGHSIRTEQLTHIDQGRLVVTTKRIVFVGTKSTISLPVAKVLNTVLFNKGIDIRVENRGKREVFLCPNPPRTNTFVLIACHLLSA